MLTVGRPGRLTSCPTSGSKASEDDFNAHVGLMERAERSVLIGVGVLLQTWWNVLPAVLWIVLALTLITAVQRFCAVWRQGRAEPPLPAEEVRVLPEWRELRTPLDSEDGGPCSPEVSAASLGSPPRGRTERRLAARAERDRIHQTPRSTPTPRAPRSGGQDSVAAAASSGARRP